VLAAKGRDFCVGLDLNDPGPAFGEQGSPSSWNAATSPAAGAAGLFAHCKRHQDAFTAVAECPKPVIAAIHGNCVGGGLDLATACDVRYAAADARFGVRETRMAIVADMGVLQRLPGIVGRGDFMELVLTGKLIDASRALTIRLVNDVFPDREATIGAALELAAEMAALS